MSKLFKILGVLFLAGVAIVIASLILLLLVESAEAKGRWDDAGHFGPTDRVGVVDWSDQKVIDVVGEVGQQMIGKATELSALSGEPVIRIFINSPGGSVVMGNVFIQAMESVKQRGSKLECAVSNIAASMAIHMLAHCDVRYVLSGGYLLFHEPRVGIGSPASPSELKVVMDGLIAATDTLDKYLRKQLGADEAFYNYHNIAQTLWQAELFQVTFPYFRMHIVQDIKLPKDKAQGMFNPIEGYSGDIGVYLPAEYIYNK